MKRVLIAEDEASIVLSLEFLFDRAGWQVSTANDGARALELAREGKPDLVVLDLMLPVVNGFEVCRALRADAATARTRILMLTARGREQEIARGFDAGADAYVTKPFSTKDLMALAERLVAPASASGQAT
jgi:DNA-binding response OmpR family regulator